MTTKLIWNSLTRTSKYTLVVHGLILPIQALQVPNDGYLLLSNYWLKLYTVKSSRVSTLSKGVWLPEQLTTHYSKGRITVLPSILFVHLILSASIPIIIDLQTLGWPHTQLYCKTKENGQWPHPNKNSLSYPAGLSKTFIQVGHSLVIEKKVKSSMTFSN